MGNARIEDDFIARTKLARERAGFTQDEIAEVLGMKQGTYKNYERNRPLPHRYVRAFCLACRVDPLFLYDMRAETAGTHKMPRKRPGKAA